MATVTKENLLTAVKTGMGKLPDYHNEIIQIYIDEVKNFMIDAGVKKIVVEDSVAVGCILRGVIDQYTYGQAKFSEYFKERVIQLTRKKPEELEGVEL